jgi:hypothetical protein
MSPAHMHADSDLLDHPLVVFVRCWSALITPSSICGYG